MDVLQIGRRLRLFAMEMQMQMRMVLQSRRDGDWRLRCCGSGL